MTKCEYFSSFITKSWLNDLEDIGQSQRSLCIYIDGGRSQQSPYGVGFRCEIHVFVGKWIPDLTLSFDSVFKFYAFRLEGLESVDPL